MKNQFSFVLLFVCVFLSSLLLFSFSISSDAYRVDLDKSFVTWQGSKVGGQHSGTILIQEGSLFTKNNKIIGGKIDIDMYSITNLDIEDREIAQKLESHLKSVDFFDVDNFPLSSIEIVEVKSKRGKDNYEVRANLTIKNITKEVIFPAQINMNKDRIIADIKLTIDRTEYGIAYMSESLIGKMKDKFIHNNFDLGIHLVIPKA